MSIILFLTQYLNIYTLYKFLIFASFSSDANKTLGGFVMLTFLFSFSEALSSQLLVPLQLKSVLNLYDLYNFDGSIFPKLCQVSDYKRQHFSEDPKIILWTICLTKCSIFDWFRLVWGPIQFPLAFY